MGRTVAGHEGARRHRRRSAIGSVDYVGPDGRDLVDLDGLPVATGDEPAPGRFLARWDSVVIGYDVRDRIMPDALFPVVVRVKNGDFLPTFTVDGFVAGSWAVEADARRGGPDAHAGRPGHVRSVRAELDRRSRAPGPLRRRRGDPPRGPLGGRLTRRPAGQPPSRIPHGDP